MITLFVLAAVMAIQTPATTREVVEIGSNVGICGALGYDVSYQPIEGWLQAIVRAEEGLTMGMVSTSVSVHQQSRREQLDREQDAITTRAAHNAVIDRQVALCEQYIVDYPGMVTRLPTTNTTIATFKQYGVDRFPE